MDFGRPFIGNGDGDALAANSIKVELVFLLNALAEVLRRHVLLCQFHLERAPLLLQFGQAAPLFPQAFFACCNIAFLGVLLSDEFRSLGVDHLPFVAQALDLALGIFNLRLPLELAAAENSNFTAALLGQLAQLRDALFERLLLLAKGGAQLLFGRQGDLRFSESAVGLIAMLAQPLEAAAYFGDLLLERALASLEFGGLSGKDVALLDSFLFLGCQALDFIDDGVNFLM